MEFDFSNFTAEQLEERRTAIIAETATATGEALELLDRESVALNAELEARAAEAARAEHRRAVADGEGTTITNFEEEYRMPAYTAASPEYRTAWLKNIAVRYNGGGMIFGELTNEERAAFTHTTANTGAVVPTTTMNRIIELVESMSPMYDDAQKTGLSQGFAIPRHKAIVAGDAQVVEEGFANVDEENEFDLFTMPGVGIKKHAVLTIEMTFRSIDAFEDWLVTEISKRIAVGREKVILARLDGVAPAGGTAYPAVAIKAGNVNGAVARTDEGIRSMMALLKGEGARTVYANNSTIWNIIAGLENSSGQKLFIPDTTSDPTTQGRIYGAPVKLDENLADGVFYIIVRSQLLVNDFKELTLFQDREPKTLNTIVTGYASMDAGLLNESGAVKGTFASA